MNHPTRIIPSPFQYIARKGIFMGEVIVDHKTFTVGPVVVEQLMTAITNKAGSTTHIHYLRQDISLDLIFRARSPYHLRSFIAGMLAVFGGDEPALSDPVENGLHRASFRKGISTGKYYMHIVSV